MKRSITIYCIFLLLIIIGCASPQKYDQPDLSIRSVRPTDREGSYVYYLVGEVREPGVIKRSAPITILDALLESQFLPTANVAQIYQIRIRNDNPIVTRLDINHWIDTGNVEANNIVEAGDVIIVGKAR